MPDPSPEQILALARICSFVVLQDEPKLRQEFQNALGKGVPVALIREAVLQTLLATGYPATINAFILLNEVAGNDHEFFTEHSASLEEWEKRGEQLCRKIYGSQYENLVHNMKQIHPDLADWMIVDGYGKVLSRPFLSPLVRELLTVAMTAVSRVERQFYSHVRGALNVGASSLQITSVFEEVKSSLDENTRHQYEEILKSLVRV